MYERPYSGNIVIACEGQSLSDVVSTPYGEMRSRSGALLKYVKSDSEGIFTKWTKNEQRVPPEANKYLENPTLSELKNAISSVSTALSGFPQDATGIDFYFAGHGRLADGAWAVMDGYFTAYDLIDHMEDCLVDGDGLRGIGMISDSCYSGALMINLMIASQPSRNLRFLDGIFSSLPDEKSWELSFLEHGAFSFTYLNPGNGYVDGGLLTRAIEQNDQKIIAKFIQGSPSIVNPTAFLTQGRQHSIRINKGGVVEIPGYGTNYMFEEDLDEPIIFSDFAASLRASVSKYK